jgi:riboflavin synthase
MFTGLITHVGDLTRVIETTAGRLMTVSVPWTDVAHGESIAVNGVCLTVVDAAPGWFSAAAVETTVALTTVGMWRAGASLNLERALRVGDRLGGHMVQGHVDGIGEVLDARLKGDAWMIDVALWDEAAGLCVPQGSITLDGVSLTVHSLPSPRHVGVSIVDYTRRHTTLARVRAGDRMNVELDIIGKYLRHMAGPWIAAGAAVQ